MIMRWILFWCLLMLCFCGIWRPTIRYDVIRDGRYDTEFPYRSCASELNTIFGSVKKLHCIVEYRYYRFAIEKKITREDLTDFFINKRAAYADHEVQSVFGTALVISNHNGYIGLMTCAHVVDFPDTVIQYFDYDSVYVKSIAFKIKQRHIIYDVPEGGDFELLIKDSFFDIALLGRQFTMEESIQIPVFGYPLGKARELELGNFLYVLGYPLGNPMITQGLVSNPGRSKEGHFLIDALFNRGYSGGIVLAIRDGAPNFELMGIVKSVSAETYWELRPSNGHIDAQTVTERLPYTGPLFVENQTNIRYGITFTVPIELIIRFLKTHEPFLESKGFYLKDWLKKGNS